MTEVEGAELTEGQGRALSGHRTAQAYRGYAKETMPRALVATRKRHGHLLAHRQLEEQSGTEFPDGGRSGVLTFVQSKRIVELASKNRLPAMYWAMSFMNEGGLMYY